MTRFTVGLLALLSLSMTAQGEELFNGKNLDGWRGDPKVWSVQDGAIVGRNTKEDPVKHNTFLIHEKPVGNFELTLKYKLIGGNSGIQYRSKVHDEKKFIVGGYQADFESGKKYSGILYEEKGRGILALRGQKVTIDKSGKKKAEQVGDSAAIQKNIKSEDWNEYKIVANGPVLKHFINGQLTAEVHDHQEGKRADSGVLALQIHRGPPMKLMVKDVVIKRGAASAGASKPAASKAAPAQTGGGTKPHWVWLGDQDSVNTVYFRKTFTLKDKPKKAMLVGTADNALMVWVNGERLMNSDSWESLSAVDVASSLKAGENFIAARAVDSGGIAAMTMALSVDGKTVVASDSSWKASTSGSRGWNSAQSAGADWKNADVVAAVGAPNLPWSGAITHAAFARAINAAPVSTDGQKATHATALNVPKGFKAERIYNVPKGQQGSWVSMTKDDKGRLYASDQGGKGIYRITPAKLGDAGATTKVEKVNVPVSAAQGMCWAFDSLYANVYGKGLYRITDSTGDGDLDKSELIVETKGGGEHGQHAVIKSPDGKGLYFLGGNHTAPPKFDSSRIPTNWAEDLLLPRQWDARGHARGKLAPGGWIARCDPDGKNVEMLSIGYRNQYDMAINRHGELFAYDADMEWDMGSPWYRPTRVCHATSGSEFGWRSGTGKWPAYFEDSLPSAVDIGPGSPTGVVFGYGAKFPAKYQEALFILDWTFGTIYAIHLKPDGSSYTATKEHFVWSKPLPVTDAIVGDDGALYFTVGGRGADSALFRVTYEGSESTSPVAPSDEGAAARKTRRSLEAFHGKTNTGAIAAAWPHLSSKDRFIRYAARIAVESQPVESWRAKALGESDAAKQVVALLALAKQGEASDLAALVGALNKIDMGSLSEHQRLIALRTYAVAFARQGEPSDALRKATIAKLDPLMPAGSDALNTELSRVLTYLQSPTVASKTMTLMRNAKPTPLPEWAELVNRNDRYGGPIAKMLDNMPPLQNITYAFILRNAKTGWTLRDRRAYFNFFVSASKHPGGASYGGFLTNIRKEAEANLTPREKQQLATALGQSLVAAPPNNIKPPKGPGKAWTKADAVAAIGPKDKLKGRNFNAGRNLFHATACSACHRFNGEGGAIGPDLTTVANKFSVPDLVESIVEPSKVISDQYGSQIVTAKDGRVALGLVVEDDNGVNVYLHDPSTPPTVFKRDQIKSIKDSPVSQMPPALINTLNPEELKDLVAYLLSGGNPKAGVFKK